MTTPPQPVRITLCEPGRALGDIELAYPLASDHAELLLALYAGGNHSGVLECRMHDHDPRLWHRRSPDERVHGIDLLLARHPYADRASAFGLILKHWPGSAVPGSHAVSSRMTDEHRARQEYIADRGIEAGYQVDIEHCVAPGTRSDVVVVGAGWARMRLVSMPRCGEPRLPVSCGLS
jgi:hypothetical protein